MTTDHPSRLSGLPVELLTEILKFLPWKDVLHLRETCRILSEATRTREIWVNLVQDHISSKEIPPHLERPIESHSSIELERLFLLWKSADIGWKKDDGHPARERSFNCERGEFAHLVEGGRWYLVTNKTGEVTYYDLEAEAIKGVQLIPRQYPQADCLVDLETDKASPLLKFNMAFSSTILGIAFTTPAPKLSPTDHAIHFWNVTSVLDESGHVAGLFASRVATFPLQRRLFQIYRISLRGSHIAFTCHDAGILTDRAVVVEWDRADGYPRYPLRTVLIEHLGKSPKIVLLPEYRLLLFRESFRLFDYSAIKESTDILGDNQDMENTLLWNHRFATILPQPTMSVFCTKNMTKVVAADYHRLYGLAISSLPSEVPSVSEILRFPEPATYRIAVGPTRGFSYHDKRPSPDLSRIFHLLAMDEDTGRIVLGFRKSGLAYVIDYAIITRS